MGGSIFSPELREFLENSLIKCRREEIFSKIHHNQVWEDAGKLIWFWTFLIFLTVIRLNIILIQFQGIFDVVSRHLHESRRNINQVWRSLSLHQHWNLLEWFQRSRAFCGGKCGSQMHEDCEYDGLSNSKMDLLLEDKLHPGKGLENKKWARNYRITFTDQLYWMCITSGYFYTEAKEFFSWINISLPLRGIPERILCREMSLLLVTLINREWEC